jgi:electron transport complex protein RnfG
MLLKHMSRSALLLGLFALVGTALVVFTFSGTATRIAEAERAFMLRSLHAVIPPERHDNDIFNDVIEVRDPALLGSQGPVTVFRARRTGQPVAVAFSVIATDGYSGPIKLLIGIDVAGNITGVRVLAHQETPGLGDKIEERRSDWVYAFNGRSLLNTEAKAWAVRRDGGEFDQFTGATITPRAVVKAVRNALLFYEAHKDTLFADARPAATLTQE